MHAVIEDVGKGEVYKYCDFIIIYKDFNEKSSFLDADWIGSLTPEI